MKSLFESVRLGAMTLQNRIVMAPLTRCRSGPDRVPNAMMQAYYLQRASAGLIITEATAISPTAVGYPDTPGIWSKAQVEGWKKITDAVHSAGGKIVIQLWHVGRVSHSTYLDGQVPVAPSSIAVTGPVRLLRPPQPHEIPRALETHEIKAIVEDYKRATQNALAAGFDGVHIHGANGYLPDQFLESGTNHRTDDYGGSLANRARFMLEIVDAAIEVCGAERVGVHLSPRGNSHDIYDDKPKETFGYLGRELGQRKIGFLFLREPNEDEYLTSYLKSQFGGPVIANEGIAPENAERVLNSTGVDLISFGRLYIANPDLVERLRDHLPLNAPNPSTFYGAGPEGYIDYPAAMAKGTA